MLKNAFYKKVEDAYLKNKSTEELRDLLGRGRAKKGMFEGDLEYGELEIGQISAYLNEIHSAKDIIEDTMRDFYLTRNKINEL